MENRMSPHDMVDDLQVCRRALLGEISLSDAARIIFDNHPNSEDPWHIDIPETDILGDLLGEIDTEIPRGQARKHWNAEALIKRDALKAQIEASYRDKAFAAFQAIIDLWQPEVLRVGLEQMKSGSEEIVETSRDFWDARAGDEQERASRDFVERHRRTVAHLSRIWEIPAHEGTAETPYFPDWVRPEDVPFAWWPQRRLRGYVAVRQHDEEFPLQFVIGKRPYKTTL